MSDGANIKFDMDAFNAAVRDKYEAGHRSGRSVVGSMARRLIKAFSWNCPKAAPVFSRAGRLCAGFWPAAIAMDITSIYTDAPNRGEGSCSHNLGSATSNPTVRITNTVPYVNTVTGSGVEWQQKALSAATERIENEIESEMQRAMR